MIEIFNFIATGIGIIFMTNFITNILFFFLESRQIKVPIILPREITVDITKDGDQFYFWNKDSGDFLAQGKDVEEIFDKCSKRFYNTKFYIPKEKAEKIGLNVTS